MSALRVNDGDGDPFLVAEIADQQGNVNVTFIHGVTPAELHRLADEMQAAMDAGQEAVA